MPIWDLANFLKGIFNGSLLYSLFWWFTRGKIVKDKFAEQGYSATGNEITYLVLGIFEFSIVSMAIMQNDFNSLKFEYAQLNQRSAIN